MRARSILEVGTEDAALAGAGQAARAQDASTLLTNPAGMTRLPDHMLTGEYRLWEVIYPINWIMNRAGVKVGQCHEPVS